MRVIFTALGLMLCIVLVFWSLLVVFGIVEVNRETVEDFMALRNVYRGIIA